MEKEELRNEHMTPTEAHSMTILPSQPSVYATNMFTNLHVVVVILTEELQQSQYGSHALQLRRPHHTIPRIHGDAFCGSGVVGPPAATSLAGCRSNQLKVLLLVEGVSSSTHWWVN